MAEAKQLKIKIGVVKRTIKELTSYDKEIQDQTSKIQKMKDDSKDSHDIKQQEEVLKEASVCLGDARRRLDSALQDLQSIIDADGELLSEKSPADFEEAKALLAANPVDDA